MVKANKSGTKDEGRGLRGSGKRYVRTLFKYLASDCFLYGPLLCRSWEGELEVDHPPRTKEVRKKKTKLRIKRCVHSTVPPSRAFKKVSGDMVGELEQEQEEQQQEKTTTLSYLTIQQEDVSDPGTHEEAVATPEARE